MSEKEQQEQSHPPLDYSAFVGIDLINELSKRYKIS